MHRRAARPLASLVSVPSFLHAQNYRLELPWPSPHATVSQVVGLTTLSVDYHRPGVNKRVVWGGLVPWDSVWRAGANENTVLASTSAFTVGGTTLPAGRYGVFMIPTRTTWTDHPEPAVQRLGRVQLRSSRGRGPVQRDADARRVHRAAAVQLRRPHQRDRHPHDALGEARGELPGVHQQRPRRARQPRRPAPEPAPLLGHGVGGGRHAGRSPTRLDLDQAEIWADTAVALVARLSRATT